jgi:hypothetical protein
MRHRFTFVIPLSAMILFSSPVLADIVISADPASQLVYAGSRLTIKVDISGLGDFTPPSLRAFDITVHWDPRILAPTLYAFAHLGSFEINPTYSGGDGETSSSVRLFEEARAPASLIDDVQPSSFELFGIHFRAKHNGASVGFFDLTINSLLDAESRALSATVRNAQVETLTPEPGSWLLFASGVLVIPLRRRLQYRHR